MRRFIIGALLMCLNTSIVTSLGAGIDSWQYWVILICTGLYGINFAID